MNLGFTYWVKKTKLKFSKEVHTSASLLLFKLIKYIDKNNVGDFKGRKLLMGNYFYINKVIVF